MVGGILSYVHTLGGMVGGIHLMYTPWEAWWGIYTLCTHLGRHGGVYTLHVHTLGGMVGIYTSMYTPWVYTLVYTTFLPTHPGYTTLPLYMTVRPLGANRGNDAQRRGPGLNPGFN